MRVHHWLTLVCLTPFLHLRRLAHVPVPPCREPSRTVAYCVQALRQEKRLIATEEKRLKALLDLEKTNGHRKGDLLVRTRLGRPYRQAI